MLLSSGIVSIPQSMCSKNQELEKEHTCVADTIEPVKQCPVLDDFFQTRLELSLPSKTLVSPSAVLSNLVSFLRCGKVEFSLNLMNSIVMSKKMHNLNC